MPGIVGYCKLKNQDLLEIANGCVHTSDQSASLLYADDDCAIAGISRPDLAPFAAGEGSAAASTVVAVDGEIFEAQGTRNPNPSAAAAFLRDLYSADHELRFLSDLDGNFAAAILDRQQNRLLLLTDPLGLKSLYYCHIGGSLFFGTELSCFAGLDDVASDINPEAISEFLQFGQLVGNTSWLKSVHLVPPGTYIVFDIARGTLTEHCYTHWSDPLQPYSCYEEALEVIGRMLGEALALQIPDGDFAVRLNGHFSARFLMAEVADRAEHVITYADGDDSSGDVGLARLTAAVAGVPNYSLPYDAKGWFQRRLELTCSTDGGHLLVLDGEPTARLMAQQGIQLNLRGTSLELLLGTAGIDQFCDQRTDMLLKRHCRQLQTRSKVWNNHLTTRLPFLGRRFVTAALRADPSYLLDKRLLLDLARNFHPDWFADIPVPGVAPNKLSERAEGRAGQKLARFAGPTNDYHNWIRNDPEIAATVWELLSRPSPGLSSHVDSKATLIQFVDYFEHGSRQARKDLLKHVSVAAWLRCLTEGSAARERKFLDTPSVGSHIDSTRSPRVSVIVPTFNVRPYIGECLNSLINQRLRDIEIIVVNDGSTDDTVDVIKRFAARDPRITLLDGPNEGVYRARNRALDIARGEYIAYADPDDYLHADMLQELCDAADRHQADVTFCDVYEFEGFERLSVRKNTLEYPPNTPFDLPQAPNMIHEGFTTLWNRAYRRSFLERHEIRFEDKYRFSADMLYLQHVIYHANCIVRVPRALYYYRFATPNSLTSYDARNLRFRTNSEINIALLAFWIDRDCFYPYAPQVITKVIRNFLWNTHIELSNLRTVFFDLHEYVQQLDLKRINLKELKAFDRAVFLCVHKGDFSGLLRQIRHYRARMVRLKGGELSRWERLLGGIGEMGIKRLRLRAEGASRNPGLLTLGSSDFGLTVHYDALTPKKLASRTQNRLGAARKTAAFRKFQELGYNVALTVDIDDAASRRKPGATCRVLHISHKFSAPSETFTYDLITGLEKRPEIENHVVFFYRELERERPFERTIHLRGLGRRDLFESSPQLLRALRAVIRRIKPDVIHCHFGWVGIPILRIFRAEGITIPLVITMHGSDVNLWPRQYFWYRDTLRNQITSQVTFTTHSETYGRRLIGLGVPPSQLRVIANSVDPRFINDQREAAPFEEGGLFRIICVARLDIWKGQTALIEGFSLFRRDTYRYCHLTLAGTGPLNRELRALASKLGERERIRFQGRVRHTDVPDLLRRHHVYVQPSIRHEQTRQEEGQPIAVLEAIASGLPVVVTDTGAMAETVCIDGYQSNAFVVPPGDPEAIADGLTAAFHRRLRGPVDQAYVEEMLRRHDQDRQIEATIAHYREVMESAAEVSAVAGDQIEGNG